ncbi:hypothetical protein F5Y08DRAFT_84288 [Xylaria arbuscula]|nr:hypothetical protein F5Y08DRAFT_84288 [Xylaria arbuscula]
MEGCQDTESPKSPRLDSKSVVITHWDEDHRGGIAEYLQQDLNRKAKKHSGEKEWDKFAAKMEKETISIFRYSDRDDKSKGLLTTLYAPYWKENAERICNGKGHGTDLPGAFDEESVDKLNYEFLTPWPLTSRKRKIAKVPNLCKLCYELDKVIGTNFLDNEGLDGKTYDSIKDKSQLAANTKSKLPVGIFCIVSKARVMGSSGMITADVDDRIHIFMEEEKATVKNRLSIGAIVLWTAAPAKATHYFAGDLSYEVETKVGAWLKVGGEPRIPNIKLRQAS